jgi:hypothetical protein
MEGWNLREKLIQFIRTWPILIIVFVGSGILSWSIVHLFPPAHRAVADLYISIDISRVYNVSSMATYAKTEPFNIDDYKHWQLAQVSEIASSEFIADRTLDHLRELDSYWEDVTRDDFLDMQGLDWYDVGVWHMRIETPNEETSLQGVQVWREILLDELIRLIDEGEDVLEFEGQMRAADDAINQLEIRIDKLELIQEELETFKGDLTNLEPQQVINQSLRDELWVLTAGNIEDELIWKQIMDDFPRKNQKQQVYLDWISRFIKNIDKDLEQTSKLLIIQEEDLDILTEVYLKEIEEANGFSASLIVGEHTSSSRIEPYYQDTVIGLLGSFLGLLIYIVAWVMIIDRKE